MSEASNQINPRRARGRPNGTAPLEKADMRLLRKVAKEMARKPGLKLTPALRDVGVAEEKNFARLRQRWNKVNPDLDLVGEARADLYRNEDKPFFETLVFGLMGFAERTTEILEALPLEQVVRQLQRYGETVQALRSHGGLVPMPIDMSSEEEIAKAVARLELRNRDFGAEIHKVVDRDPTIKGWKDTYAMAVVMHEKALEQRAHEQAQKRIEQETAETEQNDDPSSNA